MFKEEHIKSLQVTFCILEDNFKSFLNAEKEYLEAMKGFSHKEAVEYFESRSPEVTKHFKKIITKIHNYLASFYSFFAHSKAIIEKINIDKFETEYEKQKKAFLSIGENSVVWDLRTYAQHRKIPLVGGELDVHYYSAKELEENNPKEIICFLPSFTITDLLKWDRWYPTSKKFLEVRLNPINKLNISPVICIAHKNVTEFFKWFEKQIKNW